MDREIGGREGERWDRRAIALFLAVLAVASLLFFIRLGHEPYMDYDEAAYAQITRDTALSGDILTLRVLDEKWFEKPPLYFWVTIASVRVFGESEFAMRLPSALFGLLAVALTWLIAWHFTKSALASSFAGLILATTGAFVDPARQARTDVMVVALIMLAFYTFVRGLDDKRWFAGFGAAVGLAVMAKSVIGLLAYPYALIAAIAYKKWDWLKSGWFWAGQAIALAVVAPWHWRMIRVFGAEFVRPYFFVHLLERYETDLIGNGATIGTYLGFLATDAGPWAIAFAASLAFLLLSKRRNAMRHPRAIAMFFAIAAFTFAFFSLPNTKIVFYLVPMYPFVALSIAMFAYGFAASGQADGNKRLLAGAMVMLLVSGALTAIDRGFHLDDRKDIEHRFSWDERAIGEILCCLPDADPIYFLDPMYQQAVRYYGGGKRIDDLRQGTYYDRPIYIVAFTYKLRWVEALAPLASSSETLYKGEYFTLIKFGPGTTPPSFAD